MKKCKINHGFYKKRQLHASTSAKEGSIARNPTHGNSIMTAGDEKAG